MVKNNSGELSNFFFGQDAIEDMDLPELNSKPKLKKIKSQINEKHQKSLIHHKAKDDKEL